MINGDFYNEKDLRSLGFRSVGNNVKLHKSCVVVGVENITIGDNVRIDAFTSIIAAGEGFLTLGSHIHISSHCYLGCSGGIHMDDFSGLAYGVRINSGSDDYGGKYLTNSVVPLQYRIVKFGKVYLGKHVVIGSNTVILPNVNIPIGCAVGAMSFVNKSLEEWGVYFGCPVKRMSERSKDLLAVEQQYLRNEGYLND